MMNAHALHIEDLTVGYSGHTVLENFNLQMEAGKIYGLKARNGRGKTSLLRTIAGLQPAISGKVLYGEKNLLSISPAERARLVSIVLTDRLRLRGIHVEELVLMGRYPVHGRIHFPSSGDADFCREIMKQTGIEAIAHKPLAFISDGELQKTQIARALAQETPIMLLDEPSAFLDYIAREEILEVLANCARSKNISILFSSHDIDLMEKWCDEIISLPDKT